MYFKSFVFGGNTETLIEKVGFRVHSYREVKTFCGTEQEKTTKMPNDYYYDGSVWKTIDIPEFSERILLLCRMPILSFNSYWNLFLSGKKEDRFGALFVILDRYVSELLEELRNIEKSGKYNRALRKKILEICDSPLLDKSSERKEIIEIISDLTLT